LKPHQYWLHLVALVWLDSLSCDSKTSDIKGLVGMA
jgi:hypothetical protein